MPSGETFNPDTPINDSRLNTGIEELPPAQPAFIWYPYGASEEFPSVGTGGRNAMAGPVYYTDLYPEESRLPEYFNGKLFIYEWVRGWVKLVTMQPNGDFDKIESFMDDIDFNALIDVEIGPEGRIYLLEYGSGWFSKNEDSGLSYIDFNAGNRKPVVENVIVDKTSGTLPLTIKAEVSASDPENDELTYNWNLGNSISKRTSDPYIEYAYDEIGEYSITVDVSDAAGLQTSSNPISVYAGNAAPKINIEIKGNKFFYFPGTPVEYAVNVEDEDGATDDLSTLIVSADYVEGSDLAEASQGHQVMTEAMSGKSMIESLDCQACHKLNSGSIGPSYLSVAERYRDSTDAVSHLVDKIIEGGSGDWGETMMPAHPDISEADAQKMVTWIQSLAEDGEVEQSLPQTGTVHPTLGKKSMPDGVLILSASYTDQAEPDVKPLTGNTSLHLRNSTMNFSSAGNLEGYSTMTFGGNFLLLVPTEEGYFSLDSIDLTGIRSAELMTGFQEPPASDYIFEFRLASPEGKKIGEVLFKPNGQQSDEGPNSQAVNVNIEPVSDGRMHDLFIVSRPVNESGSANFVLSTIQFKTH